MTTGSYFLSDVRLLVLLSTTFAGVIRTCPPVQGRAMSRRPPAERTCDNGVIIDVLLLVVLNNQ